MDAHGSAELVAIFIEELKLCKVKSGETMLIFTDPQFVPLEYPPAAFAAARALDANVYILVSQGDQLLDDRLVRAAWKNADLILGMSMLLAASAHGCTRIPTMTRFWQVPVS
jgi:hypothetical protein